MLLSYLTVAYNVLEGVVSILAGVMAGVFAARGSSVLVVHGDDGLDEISISGPTRVIRVDEGKTEELIVTPEDFGMEPASLEDVVGGTPQENAVATLAVFDGERSARRDLVLLNAAAALSLESGDWGAGLARAAAFTWRAAAEAVLRVYREGGV